MKKLLLIILIITSLITGCTTKKENIASANADIKKTKIGIIQIVEHPSLDAARQGFLDILAENGYEEGKNLIVDYKNAQGDMPTLNTIANKLANGGNDLLLAVATPSAQAIANATKNNKVPVLFTAITDPVAAGLVESMEKPNTNLTGTTDMAPVADQIKLIKEIAPNVKNIGIIYNTSEINSVVQLEIAKKAATEEGLNIYEAVATNSSEVDQAAKSLARKVDAIYVLTDNTVVSALEAVIKMSRQNKLLVVSAEKDSVTRGTVATIALDYYKLGQQTGKMALKILSGDATPQDMPIESQTSQEVIVNLPAAEAIGIEIPDSVLKKAQEIIK
ncbi:MAG: ABC transporter substrate-binding protein [Peptococcales bacterium]|jgi:putative ABC transport system substrate-binding protein